MFPYYQQNYPSSRASNSAEWYGHANDASCPPYESQSTPYWREQHYTPNFYQQYHASHSYQAQHYDPIPPRYEHVPQYQHYIPEQQEPEPINSDLAELMQAIQLQVQFQAHIQAEFQAHQAKIQAKIQAEIQVQSQQMQLIAQREAELEAMEQEKQELVARLEALNQALQQNNDQHLAHLREEITGSQDQCEHDYGSLSNEVHHVPTSTPNHEFETQTSQQSEHALPEDFEMTDEDDFDSPYDEWITKGYAHLATFSDPVQAQQSEHASSEDEEMTDEYWESPYDEWIAKGFENLPPYDYEISNNLFQEQDTLPTVTELEEPQGEQLKDEVPEQSHAHVHKDFVDVYLETPKETPHAQQVEMLKEVVKLDTPTHLKEDPKLDVSIKLMEQGAPPEDQHEELKIGVPIRIDAPYEDVFLPLPLKPPDNFWKYMIPNIWNERSEAHYFHISKGRNLHPWYRSTLQHPIIFGGPLFKWDFKVD